MDLTEFDVLEKSIVHLIDELKKAKESDADRSEEVSTLKSKYDHTIQSLEAKIHTLEGENRSLREERNNAEKQKNIIKKRLDDIMGKIEVAKDSIEASAREKSKPKFTQIETVDGADLADDIPPAEAIREVPVKEAARAVKPEIKKREASPAPAAITSAPPQAPASPGIATAKGADVISLSDDEDPFSAASDESWEKLETAEKAPAPAVVEDEDEYLIGNEDDESESFWQDEQKA